MADKAAAIKIHNDARKAAQGGARPALVWDDNLAKHAQVWANENAKSQSMHHSTGAQRPGEGENLAAGMPTMTLEHGSQMWVNEKKNYHGEPIGQGNFGSYGHYTQVIWPETTRFGMASAKSANGWTYVVGRYSPAGNFTGKSAWRPGPSGPKALQEDDTHPPTLPKTTLDKVYLVNLVKDGKWKSGMAWYKNIGNNDGHEPDAYAEVCSVHAITWENNQQTGTFPDKVQFVANVGANGQSVGKDQSVGNGHNNYRQFTIYKAQQHVLYEKDGWQAQAIYYAK